MDKLRIGLIGLGRIGKIHYNNIKQQIPEAEVMMVADAHGDYSQYDVLSGDPSALIAHPDIDAVIICSPTDTHADYVDQCAKVGKHVFCEKPLDLSLERIKKTLDVVNQYGIELMLGFNRRFDPNFLKIKALVDEGNIGNPHVVKITSRDPAPPPRDYLKSSGGMFMDMTIHDFDMARYIMGKEVKQVFAAAATFCGGAVEAAGDIDTAVITLMFEDGSMAIIDNSRKAVYGYDQRLEVFGDRGMAHVDNNKADNHVFYNDVAMQSSLPLHFFMERYTMSYLTEMRMFVKAVQEQKKVPVDGSDGLQATLIAMAAARSYKEGRKVELSEFINGAAMG